MKSFGNWVLQFINEDSDLGHVALEVLDDDDFPVDVMTFEEIASYLHSYLNIGSYQLQLFREAFELYQKEVKKIET